MDITIIDYGMGNLKNVQKAFQALGFSAEVTGELSRIKDAKKLVLPGVGAFKDAIAALNESGAGGALKSAVQSGKYVLGVCLGMQLLFDKSYENGEYEGLGILEGEIIRFDDSINLKIPHVSWNDLIIKKEAPLFTARGFSPYVYFVHSYHVRTSADIVSATARYGYEFPAAAQKDNVFAAQFHPEKSGDFGLSMLKSFGDSK